MNKSEFKQELYQRLLELPVVHTTKSDPTQLVTRCPFCGDSQRDFSHGHFYIKIDIENDDIPIMYNCFRAVCNESGVMTPDVLRLLDIYDLSISSSLIRYNKRTMSNIPKTLGFKTGILNYKVPLSEPTPNNIRKKEYIEGRLAITLTMQKLKELKVIVSLKDFLLSNNIEKISCSPQIARQLEDDYVGFLSLKNNFIVFRDITGNHKERYIKYTIQKDLLNNGSFYAMPGDINLVTPEKIEIHIAEGTFDILGVYYNILDCKSDNRILVSVTGGNYTAPIKYFLGLGVVGDVDIHIYSDQGVSKWMYKKQVKDKFGTWVDNIYVHYNELEKDCGVSRDKISLLTYKL